MPTRCPLPFAFCLLLFALFLFPQAPCSAQSIFDSLRVARRAEVYFATGKADLTPETRVVIDSFARIFLNEPLAQQLRITAHTDSVGNPAANLALSHRRADAVQAALTQKGVPADKITYAYYGEKRPAAANTTEEGRHRNRRATLDAVFAVPMSPFGGQVKDKQTGKGIPATVQFSTKTLRDSVQTDSVGRYAVRLPKDSVVKVEAYAKGYFFGSLVQKIYGTPAMVKRMKEKPFELSLGEATSGEKAVINNLFFVGNEAVLLKSSEPELPKVLKFMQINPDIHIEIAGHINHPNLKPEELEAWEQALSVNRAKTVFTYLLQHGISHERMTYKGYGNREMLFPNPRTDGEQEQNRRVEIRVQ